MSLVDIAAVAIENNCYKVLIVNTWKGNPGKLVLYELKQRQLQQVSPIVYIKGVVLRRELRYSPYKRTRVKIRRMGYYIDPSITDKNTLGLLRNFFSFLEFSEYLSLSEVREGESLFNAIPIERNLIKLEVKMRKEDRFDDIGPIIKAVFMEVPRNVSR